MWSVVDDGSDQSPELPQYAFLDNTTLPHNNAGVYLPSDNAAALEELRLRLERLMQLEG